MYRKDAPNMDNNIYWGGLFDDTWPDFGGQSSNVCIFLPLLNNEAGTLKLIPLLSQILQNIRYIALGIGRILKKSLENRLHYK